MTVVPPISLGGVHGAALPFVLLKLVVPAPLVVWPQMATWLPTLILK